MINDGWTRVEIMLTSKNEVLRMNCNSDVSTHGGHVPGVVPTPWCTSHADRIPHQPRLHGALPLPCPSHAVNGARLAGRWIVKAPIIVCCPIWGHKTTLAV